MASASVPDGAIPTSVSDPVPLPLLGGSGLSRPHLVLATQALKLPGRPSLPGLPSLCHDQGGLVLDRVIAHGSGDSWWAVLSGRARLGRLAARRGELLAAAADVSNYGLCGTSRVQLSRHSVLRSRVDWSPPLPGAPSTGCAETASTGAKGPAGWAAPLSLSCQLRSRIGMKAEARADLAVRQRASSSLPWTDAASGDLGLEGEDGAGQQLVQLPGSGRGGWAVGPRAASTTATTPLLVGLQAGSVAAPGSSPLVWRCGVLQVTAPPALRLPGRSEGGGCGGASLQSAVYVQGTAALQGERYLWRAPKKPVRRTSGRAEAATGAAKAPPAGPPPDSQPATLPKQGPQNHARAASAYPPSGAGRGVGSGANAADDRDDPARPGAPGRAVSRPLRSSSGAGAAGAAGAGAAGGGAPFGVELPSAGQVQEALMDTTQSISRLRDDVTEATRWVGDGGLAEQLKAAGGGAKQQRQRQAPTRAPTAGSTGPSSPWSSFVGEPHVRVAGIAGLTARAPIIMLTHGSSTPAGGAALLPDPARSETAAGVEASTSSSLLPLRLAWLQDLGLKQPLARLLRRIGGRAGEDAEADGAGITGTGASPQAVSRGSLRPFASAAASVQAGRFSGWLLDYTKVTCQLDCGLWGPASKGVANGSQPPPQQQQLARHPAFALGDTGAWHSLSLSLSQQVVGPLRFLADLRYRLASSRPLALPPPPPAATQAPAAGSALPLRGSSSGGPAAAAAAVAAAAIAAGSAVSYWVPNATTSLMGHVGGMRPQLMDAAYALDLAVPGTMGAARLVAWYAPLRREGMVELRMF